MWGVGSLLAFILAFIFNVASLGKGHLNWQMLALLGLVFLAAHVTFGPVWPWRRTQ